MKKEKKITKGNKSRTIAIIFLLLMFVATFSDFANYKNSPLSVLSWTFLCVSMLVIVISLILKNRGKMLLISVSLFFIYSILGIAEVLSENGSSNDIVATVAYFFLGVTLVITTALSMKKSIRNKRNFGYILILQGASSLCDIAITAFLIVKGSNFESAGDRMIAIVTSLAVVSILPLGFFFTALWLVAGRKRAAVEIEETTKIESADKIEKVPKNESTYVEIKGISEIESADRKEAELISKGETESSQGNSTED